MKYGINMLFWNAMISVEQYSGLLAQIKEWGFDGVEIPVFGHDQNRYRKLGAKLKELGLDATTSVVVPVEANPIDADPNNRARAVEHLKRSIDDNVALGSKLMMGPFSSPVGKLVGRGRTEDEWKWGVEVMQQIAPYAQKNGVMLALEYLNRFEHYFINITEDAARFADEVNHPFFKIHYDTFHANIEEKGVGDAIRAGGKRIVHVHISENDRSTPGEGHVHWDENFKTLSEIGYDGWMMIEAFGNSLPELAGATCIWRKMFPNEEHLARNGLKFMKSKVAQYWS